MLCGFPQHVQSLWVYIKQANKADLWSSHTDSQLDICGVIKQNQSEVGQI